MNGAGAEVSANNRAESARSGPASYSRRKLLDFAANVWWAVGLFGVFVAVFGGYVKAVESMDRAHEVRHQSFLLVDELRQTSDDLTRMVRTYVATGEGIYKRRYYEILDIREGRMARPAQYQRIYWDIVAPDDVRPRPVVEAIPLLTIMQRTGFTAKEVAGLAEAKAKADAMSRTEFSAMQIIESSREPTDANRLRAIKLLHDAAYHQAKSKTMGPIDQVLEMVDIRTAEAVEAAEKTANLLCVTLALLGSLLLLQIWVARRNLRIVLGGALTQLSSEITRLGDGDFTSAVAVPAGAEESILGRIAGAQAKLAKMDAERRHAEDNLAQSENRFRSYFNLPLIGIAITSLDKGWIEVNPRLCDILGYSKDELAGLSWAEITHPDDLGPDLAEFRRVLKGEIDGYSMEKRFVRKDGRVVYSDLSVCCVRTNSGRADYFVALIQDITERKQVQDSLQESDKRFKVALANSPIVVFEQDLNLRYVWIYNPKLGYAANEVIGKTDADLMSPVFAKAISAIKLRVIDQGKPVREEVVTSAPGGAIQYFDLYVEPRHDGEGNLVGVICAATDITEHLMAEQRLRKLSQAVEQSPASIMITDVRAQIEYVNEAFVHTTGYGREDVLGKNPRMLQSGKTPCETYENLWSAMTQGAQWKGELYNRKKDGTEYVEFAVISPLRQSDDSISHYVAVKEDITERKRLGAELNQHRQYLEELVVQRTKELTEARHLAEAANLAKSSFLANMSHEIRTPMNGILGMANLLRRGGVTPSQAERLDRIDASARHLLGIIDDILDISKIEAGKLVLEEAPISVCGIVGNVRSILADRASEKGIQLAENLESLPLLLAGDATRLQQCLLNYATNAIKFTEAGTVTLGVLALHEDANNVLVRFEVEDTGIGIPAESLAKIFAPFEQADNSTTRKYGGTGLGLAITRRLAELMGGEVGAESRPGVGSTFWFTARLKKSIQACAGHDAAEGDAETLLQQKYKGGRILIVDDEEINREVAKILLEDAGLVVDTADDGEVAIDMARSAPYIAILMDMQMPNVNGTSATQAIRHLPGCLRTPIIAVTANAFAEDRKQCLDAGMNDFLVKPFRPDVLFSTLLRSLDQAAT
jgi:two-component system sensor histidine kinase/response regulator